MKVLFFLWHFSVNVFSFQVNTDLLTNHDSPEMVEIGKGYNVFTVCHLNNYETIYLPYLSSPYLALIFKRCFKKVEGHLGIQIDFYSSQHRMLDAL